MVDTDRMRRVLERVRPGPPPPPPGPMPGPPPISGPLPIYGPAEWMRQERELTELLRLIGRKSPFLRRRMMQLMESSVRRQNDLRGYVPWTAPPPRVRDGTISDLLRRGERKAGGLRENYAGESVRDRTFAALARSAGQTERTLRELTHRMK